MEQITLENSKMVADTDMMKTLGQMVISMKESIIMIFFMDTVLTLLLMAVFILGSIKMAKFMDKERLYSILVL